MPTYNANVLPVTSGLGLGNPNQRWNGYFQTLNLTGLITGPGYGVNFVAFSSAPAFDGSNAGIFEMTITANVVSSTISNLRVGTYTFVIKQDAIGGHLFAWPASFRGAMVIDPTPSAICVQQFVYDGVDVFALSAGVSM